MATSYQERQSCHVKTWPLNHVVVFSECIHDHSINTYPHHLLKSHYKGWFFFHHDAKNARKPTKCGRDLCWDQLLIGSTITRQLDQRRKNSMAPFEHLMHFLKWNFPAASQFPTTWTWIPRFHLFLADVWMWKVSVDFLGPLFTFSHLATILSTYLWFY